MTDYPLSGEPFCNVPSEVPLVQLHSISLCPKSTRQSLASSSGMLVLMEIYASNSN